MEIECASDPGNSHLGLQIIPNQEGVEIVFTVTDGTFADIPDAEDYFQEQILQETKELRKLQALMGLATVFQAYQITEGIRDNDIRVIIPITVVSTLMFYVRNRSMHPALENKRIATEKSQLLQDYENNELPDI